MVANQPTTVCEAWKPIPGYEGRYSVSDRGRVARGSAILCPYVNPRGYVVYKLRANSAKAFRPCQAARLVLAAFVGCESSNTHARHLDGNPLNNALPNLAWGTPRENMADQYRHGTRIRGERHHQAVISEQMAKQILDALKGDETQEEIARRFRVSRLIVNQLNTGRTWKHIPRPVPMRQPYRRMGASGLRPCFVHD